MPHSIDSVKSRKDFLRARDADSTLFTSGLLVQLSPNGLCAPRYGVTATKKLGNAVARNRIKRRLREIVRLEHRQEKSLMEPGFDYILIGRPSTKKRDFAALRKDFRYALHQLTKKDTKAK